MAPRSTTLPSAQTESARELARKFFCEMCGKGYARINEFEAHENSYDHQHRKRLKEMKALTRNPTAAVRDNRAEKKRKENSEMMSVNLQEVGGAGQRPSNATGFRDAMQIKSAPTTTTTTTTTGTGTGEVVKGFPEGRIQRQDEGTGRREGGEQQQQEKTMRPPLWDELDEFYTRVDVAGLPAQMLLDDRRDAETDVLPWGRIWKDENEMSKFLDAVDREIDGLEGGEARAELKRSWDELSDGGGFDNDHDYEQWTN